MNFEMCVQALCPELEIRQGVALKRYTTLRVGGPADYFVEPETENEICGVLKAASDCGVPVLLLGNGSNLLIRDGGFRGAAVHLGPRFSRIEKSGQGLYAQAGALLSQLARRALEEDYTGLEFAQGIPGTVGGGVYMNAGAYGGEMSRVVSSVRILEDGCIREIDAARMDFSYRHTRAMEENWIILGASFHLEKGEHAAIGETMRDLAARRREKQPLEYPSAGSFFKRPQGYFAGTLIDQAGLKGISVGDAQVSEKHAGFLINRGDATAADFIALKEKVQQAVEARFGVHLENEVRILGNDV